jgi:integrase
MLGHRQRRLDETKSTARRTIPLPKFAIEMLHRRRHLPYFGEQTVIFPSTAGTLRDPNNFAKEWRTARDELGLGDATTHSFARPSRHSSTTKDCPPASAPCQHVPNKL